MTTQIRAFRPFGDTQNIAVTTSAQTINLVYLFGTRAIRVCNIGTQTIFFVINDGTSSNTASINTSTPVPAGNTEIFTLPTGATSISVIAASAGSTFYVTEGEGL